MTYFFNQLIIVGLDVYVDWRAWKMLKCLFKEWKPPVLTLAREHRPRHEVYRDLFLDERQLGIIILRYCSLHLCPHVQDRVVRNHHLPVPGQLTVQLQHVGAHLHRTAAIHAHYMLGNDCV